jgi:hypothetical protein
MRNNIIGNYLKDIHWVHSRGDAREESYYSAIERLVQDMAAVLKIKSTKSIRKLKKLFLRKFDIFSVQDSRFFLQPILL